VDCGIIVAENGLSVTYHTSTSKLSKAHVIAAVLPLWQSVYSMQ